MDKKQEHYKWIKLAGFAFFVPVTLAAGPLLGYFAGYYLQTKYFPAIHLAAIFMLVGLLAGTLETIRIIKVMIKLEKGGK